MAVLPQFSNQLNVSFTRLCGNSESLGNTFPAVGILNPGGGLATAFGFQPFSAINLINGDCWHFTNDFTVYQGGQSITIGTSNQLFSFGNYYTSLANPNLLRFAGYNEEAGLSSVSLSRGMPSHCNRAFKIIFPFYPAGGCSRACPIVLNKRMASRG